MDENILNRAIYKIINKKTNYLGLFTIEEFNNLNIYNIPHFCLILFINTISSNLGHYVVCAKNENDFYFFDSYGFSPYSYSLKIPFSSKLKKYYLSFRLQSNLSSNCGVYAIFFIHLITHCNYNMICFKSIFTKLFNQKNYLENDKYIIKYLFKYFPSLSVNCEKVICNNQFVINRKKCIKYFCVKYRKNKNRDSRARLLNNTRDA